MNVTSPSTIKVRHFNHPTKSSSEVTVSNPGPSTAESFQSSESQPEVKRGFGRSALSKLKSVAKKVVPTAAVLGAGALAATVGVAGGLAGALAVVPAAAVVGVSATLLGGLATLTSLGSDTSSSKALTAMGVVGAGLMVAAGTLGGPIIGAVAGLGAAGAAVMATTAVTDKLG